MKIRQVFRLRDFKLVLLVDERIYRDFAELQVNSLIRRRVNKCKTSLRLSRHVSKHKTSLTRARARLVFKILDTYTCYGLLVRENNSFHAFSWFQKES